MQWRHTQPRELRAGQTLVYVKPSFDFSFSSVAFVVVMLLIGVAAVNTQTNLFFGVFGLMAGAIAISTVMSFASLRRIQVRRQMPEFLSVGTEEVVIYHLANGKRFWPLLAAGVGELDGCEAFVNQPYTYVPHAAAGETVEARCHIIPRRRGVYALHRQQVSSSFPFGFVSRAITLTQPETFVVFPALARLHPRLLQLCHSAENTGSPMRPTYGGEDEFYGSKEYRLGENPRWINWKRSARTGQTIMREMTRVAPPRLVLLVDTCLDAGDTDSASRVERVVAMAASIASDALEKGYPVGLCAWNDGWLQVVPARGKRQRLELLGAMARLPHNARHTTDELLAAAAHLITPGSTRVLLTPAQHPESRHGGGGVVLSAASPWALSMFSFGPGVEFEFAAPAGAEAAAPGPLRPTDIKIPVVPPAHA